MVKFKSFRASPDSNASYNARGSLFASFGVGLGLGALLMYFSDPERGRARRAAIVAQAAGRARRAGREFARTGRDWGNRARGALAQMQQLHGGRDATEEVSDDVLVRRIRSQMGHHVDHPGVLTVQVLDGVVIISGPVRAGEEQALLNCVGKVRGVRAVRAHLSSHDLPLPTDVAHA